MKSPVSQILKTLHDRYAELREGTVADYIPELAKADPDLFGICIATRDGHLYEVGDTRQKFTIQSISKALTYGLALEDRGEEHVLSRIGVEPSGDAFNAISLKPDTGVPFNPMINAGAIATCGQILKSDGRIPNRADHGLPVTLRRRASSGSMRRSTARKARPGTATGRSAGCCGISASSTRTRETSSRPISSSARCWSPAPTSR